MTVLSVFQKTLYIVWMVRFIPFSRPQAHSLDRHSHLAYVHFAVANKNESTSREHPALSTTHRGPFQRLKISD
jgi:hypothetical protein